MALLIGKEAPEFTAKAVFKDTIKEINLADYRKNKYVVLFFYPLDFTFVCPTELHAFQEKLEEFKKLNTEVLACSIDSEFCHKAWLNTPKSEGGIKGIEYGVISDLTGDISYEYDVLSEDGVAFRGLFLIDKDGIVRHQMVNDLPLGRNVDEALRMVRALQFHEQHGEVCPANWNEGEKAIDTTQESVGAYLASK